MYEVISKACHGPTLVGRPGVGPGRARPAGPINFLHDRPRPGPSIFQRMGRVPAQPITFSKMHGPARPVIFSNGLARLGPAHHMAARPMRHGLYVGRPDNYVGRPVDLTGRSMCCPVLKGPCAYADVILKRKLLGFCCFLPVRIPWDSCFRPMRNT